MIDKIHISIGKEFRCRQFIHLIETASGKGIYWDVHPGKLIGDLYSILKLDDSGSKNNIKY